MARSHPTGPARPVSALGEISRVSSGVHNDKHNAGNVITHKTKYGGWARPVVTFVIVGAAITVACMLAGDYLNPSASTHWIRHAPNSISHATIAYFMLTYLAIMFVARYYESGSWVLYDLLWCCNMAMLMSSIGLLTNRPMLVGASIAGVACDQLCWYIDIVGKLVIGKYPVGAAKYLSWPDTTIVKKLTSTHHLWFLPLCLYTLQGEIPAGSWLNGCVFTSLSSITSRYVAPLWTVDHKGDKHYTNVNAGHEFWRDVHVPFLHRFNSSPAYMYLPFLVIVGNLGLNGLPFFVLQGLASFFQSHHNM